MRCGYCLWLSLCGMLLPHSKPEILTEIKRPLAHLALHKTSQPGSAWTQLWRLFWPRWRQERICVVRKAIHSLVLYHDVRTVGSWIFLPVYCSSLQKSSNITTIRRFKDLAYRKEKSQKSITIEFTLTCITCFKSSHLWPIVPTKYFSIAYFFCWLTPLQTVERLNLITNRRRSLTNA
jgi:hypothetical protein